MLVMRHRLLPHEHVAHPSPPTPQTTKPQIRAFLCASAWDRRHANAPLSLRRRRRCRRSGIRCCRPGDERMRHEQSKLDCGIAASLGLSLKDSSTVIHIHSSRAIRDELRARAPSTTRRSLISGAREIWYRRWRRGAGCCAPGYNRGLFTHHSSVQFPNSRVNCQSHPKASSCMWAIIESIKGTIAHVG